MSERNRPMSFPRYSARKCERRPVTKEDTWCRQTMPAGYEAEDDAPMGEVVSITAWKWPKQLDLGYVGGTIVRSKMRGHTLLLQVVKTNSAPRYYVTIERRKLINIKSRITG